jgi:hypothetical protein
MQRVEHRWTFGRGLEGRCVEGVLGDHVRAGGNRFEHRFDGSRHAWRGLSLVAGRHDECSHGVGGSRNHDQLHARHLRALSAVKPDLVPSTRQPGCKVADECLSAADLP